MLNRRPRMPHSCEAAGCHNPGVSVSVGVEGEPPPGPFYCIGHVTAFLRQLDWERRHRVDLGNRTSSVTVHPAPVDEGDPVA